MRITQSLKTAAGVLAAVLFLVVMTENGSAQGKIRNGGTIVNGAGKAITAKQFNNSRSNTAGSLDNAGTVTVSNGGGFFNYDSSGGTGVGSVVNYISGTGAGIIVAVNVANGNGSFDNDQNFTYTGELQVAGSLTNGSGTFDTDSGIVVYNGSGAQSIFSTNYGDLRTATGGTKSTGASVVVNRQVDIGASTTLQVAGGTTLTLNGTSPFTAAVGTFNPSGAGATVDYAATGNQDVRGANYANLTIAAGGTKTVNTGAATLDVSGALTNAANLDLVANALTTGASATISNTDTIQTQGNVTFGAAHTIGGAFVYEAGSGSQSVGGASYANLTLQGAGTKNLPNTTVSVSGTYSVTGGVRSYASGTFAYNGTGASSAQSVVGGESYNNLTITGASDTTFTVGGYKRASANLSVSGALAINANNVLDMQSNSITTMGSGSNSGKIMWAAANNQVLGGTGDTEFYSSTAATILASASYGKILFTGGGAKTVGGAVTSTGVVVSNNLTVNSSGALTVNGDFDNTGSVTNDGTISVQ